jgi:hypothetical protein
MDLRFDHLCPIPPDLYTQTAFGGNAGPNPDQDARRLIFADGVAF